MSCDKKKCCSIAPSTLVLLGVILAALPPLMCHMVGAPFSYMWPNLLLFTPFRELAKDTWEKTVQVSKAVKRHPTHIAEIEAKDYTFDNLRLATDNWRHPAVVIGLFKDTVAYKYWKDEGFLAKKIGDIMLPIVQDAKYGTLQNDRKMESFADAYSDVLNNLTSKKYIFFPVKSRFNFNGSAAGSHEAIQARVNELALTDLELHRIWPGFGTPYHKKYVGAQLIFGRGANSSDETTGTGWHCAGGNNYFIQVAGMKRWYFMDPEYSYYMSPLRGGLVNMMTGNRKMSEIHDNIPLRYADIRAGDLLYNPDWEWHTIKNYEGLSIGCPIRELNISLTLRNNLQYTSIILINKLLDKMGGLSIGGYPPN